MKLIATLSLTLGAAAAMLPPSMAETAVPDYPELGGLKVAGAVVGETRKFRKGEVVPLEVVIHNPTGKAMTFSYPGAWWFCGPSVMVKRDGKPAQVRHTELFGSVVILSQSVQPGGTFRLKHAGLVLGPQKADAAPSAPYLLDPKPGKYQVYVQFEASADRSLGKPRVTLNPPLEIEIIE